MKERERYNETKVDGKIKISNSSNKIKCSDKFTERMGHFISLQAIYMHVHT